MQDEEGLADDIALGDLAPAAGVVAVGGVVTHREVMMIAHGVLLVQRDGIAVAADFGQVTIITGGNLPAIVGRDRLRSGHGDAVDLELTFRVHA